MLEEKEQSGAAEERRDLKYIVINLMCIALEWFAFELLTGKVPFEDSHLQGDKMSRNIRAGERPLFPFHSPKFITNLTKRSESASKHSHRYAHHMQNSPVHETVCGFEPGMSH